MSFQDSPIKCDVEGCGLTKGPNNHWYAVWTTRNGVYHACAVAKAPVRTDLFHACGAAHEAVLHSRWIASGGFTKEVHPDVRPKPTGLTEAAVVASTGGVKEETAPVVSLPTDTSQSVGL